MAPMRSRRIEGKKSAKAPPVAQEKLSTIPFAKTASLKRHNGKALTVV